jgi:hypothetical protein
MSLSPGHPRLFSLRTSQEVTFCLFPTLRVVRRPSAPDKVGGGSESRQVSTPIWSVRGGLATDSFAPTRCDVCCFGWLSEIPERRTRNRADKGPVVAINTHRIGYGCMGSYRAAPCPDRPDRTATGDWPSLAISVKANRGETLWRAPGYCSPISVRRYSSLCFRFSERCQGSSWCLSARRSVSSRDGVSWQARNRRSISPWPRRAWLDTDSYALRG